MSILSSANFKKDPPWNIFSLSVHAPATSVKRDIRAAMDGEDVASNIEKKEEEPEKKDEEPSTSHHLKEISPYFSLYKYRL